MQVVQPHARRRAVRRGFTLIELLIAVTIFGILATLAISAFQESDQDRAAAGAQQLRSMLEGARSRAIHDRQVRGVRLLLDQKNLKTVTSLIYIGAPQTYTGRVTAIRTADLDGAGTNPARVYLEIPTTSIEWENLRRRGLIARPKVDTAMGAATEFNILRIEYPVGSDTYYQLMVPSEEDLDLDHSSGNHYYTEPMNGNLIRLPLVEYATIGADLYSLELLPPLLTGVTPQPLATGIAIDLVGSQLPAIWRNDGAVLNDPMQTTDTYWTDDAFSTSMDILFSPRGDIVGQAAASGLLNFVIADVEDILTDTRYPSDAMPLDYRHPLLQVQKKDRQVTLFTRTGLVTTSQVNHFNQNSRPYATALRGKDAP